MLRLLALALLLTASATARTGARWVAAETALDVDGDGRPDAVRLETARAEVIQDPEPCAGCGRRVEGRFEIVVELSRSGRTVRSPADLHARHERLSFNAEPTGVLHAGDYDGDGQPEVNLGQFTNSNKWEYGLFTLRRDGRAVRLAKDAPEIYVAPGGEPSTGGIGAIPGGFRFRDFGNAGESPGWALFTCLWQPAARTFRCSEASIPPPDR